MRMLVVAPHPDDEVLGLGGAIHRFAAEGHPITVAIATKGWTPLFSSEQVERVRAEARAANDVLGTKDLRMLDLPVTRLAEMPEAELNETFETLIQGVQPEGVFLPFPGDRHEDHRQIFDACMVALRPQPARQALRLVLCYETVSETHWSVPAMEPAFTPQHYIDVSDHLDAKCEAMRCYRSQLQEAPSARSMEAIRSLAVWRGSTVGLHAAEAFMVVRSVAR